MTDHPGSTNAETDEAPRTAAGTAARVAGAAGLAGSLLLIAYFSGGMRLPSNGASAAQILAFAREHEHGLMLAGWLQAVGTTLGAIFFLALAEAASRRGERLLTKILGLGVAALVALSLLESILIQDIAEAARNGHLSAVIASFDQQNVFGHAFLAVAAPLVYASTALILRGSKLLAPIWTRSAAALAIIFALLGLLGLFTPRAQDVAVVPLMGQAAWILGVSVLLLVRRPRDPVPVVLPADIPTRG